MTEVGSRFQRTYDRPLGTVGRSVRGAFWWESALKIHGWSSEFASVDATLHYLHERKIGSEGSRRSYGYYFAQFCLKLSLANPDELTSKEPEVIAKLINEFVRSSRSWSNHYRNTVTSYLVMHFKNNGFERQNSLLVKSYRVPRRSRINPEHIPTKNEIWSMAGVADTYERALLFFLYGTGLRVSSLCAVKYGDVRSEFESIVEPMFIPVFPEMKLRVSGACKGNVPYYTFIKGEQLESLRVHVRLVKDYLGGLFSDETYLFPPMAPCTPKVETASLALSRHAVFHAVKHLAKKAGIVNWFDIYPHCLRKAYQRVLRSQKSDGTFVDVKTQEFLMGHVLPGQQEYYFGSGVYVSASTRYAAHLVDDLRRSYEGLVFDAKNNRGLPTKDKRRGKELDYLERISKLEQENQRLRAEIAAVQKFVRQPQ